MRRRVFVLEMSGPTLGFLRERQDDLPCFRRFLEGGARARMVGPLQPHVATSYGTLHTGRNPGKTGLYDSYQFRAGGYDRIPYALHLVPADPFFVTLARHGRRVGLLNVPVVQPIPEVDGFVVSGDDASGDDYARPTEVRERLDRLGYVVPFAASYSPGREQAFVEHAVRVLELRQRALRALFAGGNWDFGMLTLHLYGELLHAFWRFYDARHPLHRPYAEVFRGRDPLRDVLMRVDGMLAEIVEMTGPGGVVLALGAWGHRLEHTEVHLNALLERAGFLRFRRAPASLLRYAIFRLGLSPSSVASLAQGLGLGAIVHGKTARRKGSSVAGTTFLSYADVDWPRTRAVAMGYLGQVHLNVRGHRPAGAIDPAQYEAERERVRLAISALRDARTGLPVVERVWRREEIYSGTEVTHAPDLVVDFREGYTAHWGIAGGGRTIAPSPASRSSNHGHEGYLLALGDEVRPGGLEARLEDVAPTVLDALGVAPPADLDGRVLPLLR